MNLTDAEREAILGVFAGDAPSRAEELDRALADLRTSSGEDARPSIAALDFQAHALRGAAATVGLDELAALAGALEDAAAAWEPEAFDHDAVVTAAEVLLERIQAFVRGRMVPGGTATAEPSGRPIVLHIEDNLSNLKLVERILDRRPQLELREATSGAEGLALAAELQPSLILLDLRLPDVTGDGVLRGLRENESTRAIPVVVISAEARPAESDRLIAAGAEHFLVKPIDVASFLDIVDRMLARAQR